MGIYAKEQNLDKYNVFLEGDGRNNPMFFSIEHLPDVLTYGKHMFTIEIRDFPNTYYRLKNDSPILFEFKDSVGNIIFSDSTKYNPVNDSYICFVYIKEDPLRTYDYIHNGVCTLTLLGELESKPQYADSIHRLPDSWVDNYNYRCKFTYDIQKTQPNISPILFKETPQLTISQSIETDTGDSNYERNYLIIQADKLQTYGGKVEYLDLSSLSDDSQTDEFSQLGQIQVEDEFEALRSPIESGSNWVGDFSETSVVSRAATVVSQPTNVLNYWFTGSLSPLAAVISDSSVLGSATRLSGKGQLSYSSLRKTQGVEEFTLKYEVSGSGTVQVYEQSGSNGTTKSFLRDEVGVFGTANSLRFEKVYEKTFTNYNPSSSLGPKINGDIKPELPGYYIQDDIIINDKEHGEHYNQKFYVVKFSPTVVFYVKNVSLKTKKIQGVNPNFYIHKEDLGNG